MMMMMMDFVDGVKKTKGQLSEGEKMGRCEIEKE
jgi:hypothetical protein